MHSGGYNSDIHLAAGPVGNNTQVRSRQGSNAPGGMCATTTFTQEGLLVVFCGFFGGFELNLLEPRTLKLLAKYALPMRPSTFEGVVKFDPDIFMKDTSSSYFYLDHEDFVVIADNADPQTRVLVIRRGPQVQGNRLVCQVPVFEPGESVIEIPMIAWGNTIITKNDAGYRNAFEQKRWDTMRGGMVRIDIREDQSGCDIVWTSDEIMPAVVPKLSAANGLIYSYTFAPQENGHIAWYVVAIDAATGRTVFKILTGAGRSFDGNWAPMAIGPDGTLYTGSLEGFIAIWDEA
jgi:hypothetical protein